MLSRILPFSSPKSQVDGEVAGSLQYRVSHSAAMLGTGTISPLSIDGKARFFTVDFIFIKES